MAGKYHAYTVTALTPELAAMGLGVGYTAWVYKIPGMAKEHQMLLVYGHEGDHMARPEMLKEVMVRDVEMAPRTRRGLRIIHQHLDAELRASLQKEIELLREEAEKAMDVGMFGPWYDAHEGVALEAGGLVLQAWRVLERDWILTSHWHRYDCRQDAA